MRERMLAAALALFGEHGVGGTSVEMIAARSGEPVPRDFPDKDAIVLGVIGPALDRLGPIADHAEAQRGHAARREAALSGLVELVVAHRRVVHTMSFEPAVVRLVRAHPGVRGLQRVRRLLGASAPDAGSRVRFAMLSGGLI